MAGSVADLNPDRLRNGRRYQARVVDRRETDEEGAIGEMVDDVGGELETQASLAGAAGSCQRHQADIVAAEHILQLAELLLAADQRAPLDRQVVGAKIQRTEGRELGRQARRRELEDVLRSDQVLEPKLAETDECETGQRRIPDQVVSRLRQQDLATVPGHAQSGAAVDRRAVVVAIS